MNEGLKQHLEELEKEFTTIDEPLQVLRKQWNELREKIRPMEDELSAIELRMDAARHNERYKQLSDQLPHLRKAVGQ